MEIINRKARFDYFIEEEYEAGIALIGEYKEGNIFNHDETRSRKLLLHKKEIKKISQQIELNGLTLVPLKGYFKDNHFKILLGVCRGKKTFDKRETIKERDIRREVLKNIKNK